MPEIDRGPALTVRPVFRNMRLADLATSHPPAADPYVHRPASVPLLPIYLVTRLQRGKTRIRNSYTMGLQPTTDRLLEIETAENGD